MSKKTTYSSKWLHRSPFYACRPDEFQLLAWFKGSVWIDLTPSHEILGFVWNIHDVPETIVKLSWGQSFRILQFLGIRSANNPYRSHERLLSLSTTPTIFHMNLLQTRTNVKDLLHVPHHRSGAPCRHVKILFRIWHVSP